MDDRIEDILKSLIANIETLDSTLLRLSRSEFFNASECCLGMVEHIRETCISTLQVTQSVERRLQGMAFIIPENALPTLE